MLLNISECSDSVCSEEYVHPRPPLPLPFKQNHLVQHVSSTQDEKSCSKVLSRMMYGNHGASTKYLGTKWSIHDNELMESQGNPETVPRGSTVNIQTYQWSSAQNLKFAKLWAPGPLPKSRTSICIYVCVHFDDILPEGCFKPPEN